MTRTTALALFILLPALALRTSPAAAQGSARSMDIDVSIRSAGMGGASNAVTWGGGLNHWGNPALLGAERGFRYEWGRTQLVPDLASDVIFESHVVKFSGGGLGFVMSGIPTGRGVRLEYGLSEGTDPSGNPTGTFAAFEQVDSWGFGISAFETIESLAQLNGEGGGPLSRYVDIAFGMNFKEVELQLAPDFSGRSTGTAHDWGATVRLTPVNIRARHGTPVRLDAVLGISELSANDDALVTFPGFPPFPVSRHRRGGAALRVSADPSGRRPSDRSEWSWFEEGLSPMFSFGLASDRAKISAGPSEDPATSYETVGSGIEVAFANVLWGRAGHYIDREGDISGETWGWGLQLPLGRFAGIRYDGAQFPQATGLRNIVRHGASVWIDPFEIGRYLRTRDSRSI